jgi:citrate synthase
MSKDDKTINLNYAENQSELNIKQSTRGPDVIDLKRLNRNTGLFTYDPSYGSTASCESQITYIDGSLGILAYRGYPIEQLAENSTYLEVAYLLYHGELPRSEALDEFRLKVKQNMNLDEGIHQLFKTFPKTAHPMSMMATSMAALSIYHPNVNIREPKCRDDFFFNVLGKTPMLAAVILNTIQGSTIGTYKEALNYSGNVLNLFFGGAGDYAVNPVFSKALDVLLILHADHEQNCSTSSVRLSGSSGTNPYAAMSSGVSALWGPLHGGANEAVVRMFDEIKTIDRIGHFMDKAKDHDDPFRLMGFGHRVYKNYDPRAAIIKETCHTVLKEIDQVGNPIFELALSLEEIALNDEYFIEHNLYPNVDFYSGIIYKAIGIPLEMFTVMFALSRTVGWATHWCEMMSSPKTKIGRPRQLYTGPTERDYIPIEKR